MNIKRRLTPLKVLVKLTRGALIAVILYGGGGGVEIFAARQHNARAASNAQTGSNAQTTNDTQTTAAAPAAATANANIAPFTLPAKLNDKFVSVEGARLRYVEAGRGSSVIILLHGLGGDATHWGRNVLPLAAQQHHRVIALDQIGFGLSDKPPLEYRIETLVRFLAGFMDALKIKRATLIGNSMGGWVAAAFALAHQERVKRLVVADSIGLPLPPNFNSQAKPNPTASEEVKVLLATLFHDDATYANANSVAAMRERMKTKTGEADVSRRLMMAYWRALDTLDARKLSELRVPTLIVWGRQDELIPLPIGQTLHRLITNSQLLILDDCGHLPQIEQAAKFNRAVEDFLTNKSLPSSSSAQNFSSIQKLKSTK